MQYDNLNDKTADLFDETLSATEKEKIIQQLDKLCDSANDLQLIHRTASALTPKIQIKASKTLKDKVMKQINESNESISGKSGRIIPMLRSTWKKIASIAAILLVALAIVPIFGPKFFNPNAKALSLLNTSIEAILNIKSMVINYQVRSVPGDNLDLIDIKGDFIDYKLWKEFIPTEKWRIQKPGLAVVMDGQKQYRYMEKSGVGLVGSPEAGFVEWMRILLDPEKIMQQEKVFADMYKAKYNISTSNSETILTIKAKALGNFKNALSLNSSIPESDNRRVYHFDKQNGRLKALEVYILDKSNETMVLKISNISYDEAIAPETFRITLPENTKWVELKDLEPKKEDASVANNAEEAAKIWWKALSENDWAMVYKLDPTLEHSSNLDEMKLEYGGLQVISVGKSFKSGLYTGKYVPYEVKLKSGNIQKYNLAVRNDNPEKLWVIDGGY